MAETLRRYCSCGATATGRGSTIAVAGVMQMWEAAHLGPGHTQVTARQAAAARRRNDQEDVYSGEATDA